MDERALRDNTAQIREHTPEHLATRSPYVDTLPPATSRPEHVRSMGYVGGLIARSQQLFCCAPVRRVLEASAAGKHPSPIVPIAPPGFVVNNFVRAVTKAIDSVDAAPDENVLAAA